MPITQGLRPGALLYHDTYRIEQVLGQGGFGITYMATDLNLDRKVAIKEFFPKDYCDRDGMTSHVSIGTASSAEFVGRLKDKFLKEARNIAKFSNTQNIIKIHTAFEENNTAYYVMDYIDGASLSEIVKEHGPVSVERALNYVDQVADALEYVHQRKMNHLDVKPANVMIRNAEDTAVLIDFGLSKQYDSKGNQTSTTPVGLSQGYAPLEQYGEGGLKEFSPQTDLYSLAATFYYIISGVVPPAATKLVDEDLTFPPSIPQSLVPVLTKAMSISRKKRYETVRQFADQLRAAYNSNTQPKPKPKPKKVEEPNPDTIVQPADPKYAPVQKKKIDGNGKGIGKILLIAVVCAIAVFMLIVFFSNKDENGGEQPTPPDTTSVNVEAEAVPTTATDLDWKSPLGKAVYTGEIDPDGKPHGLGVAKITEGTFKGAVYDGEFVHGNMEGQAVYTIANGDRFEGTFKDNRYHKGKYFSKEFGQYFEGSFKADGNPDKGDWKPIK